MKKGASQLETHPDGSSTVNAIVNDNWEEIDAMFSPTLGLTISQSGTTVTASGDVFDADDAVDDGGVKSKIRFNDGTEVTITAYTSATTVTVNVSQTKGSQAFELYRPGQSQKDALLRGLTKARRILSANNNLFLSLDTTTGKLVPRDPFPVGMITIWYGTVATIPAGWHLCDGTDDTPNLMNVFLVGAQEDQSGQSKTNVTGSLTKTGGSATHSHTIPNTGSSTDTLDTGTDVAAGTDLSATTAGHTHTTGPTDAGSSLPPYAAVCFIIKMPPA